MPPMDDFYAPHLFSPTHCTSIQLLEEALAEFDSLLTENTYQNLLNQVVKNENASTLAFILARTSTRLADWLQWSFVPDVRLVETYSTSLHYKLASSIAPFFLFHANVLYSRDTQNSFVISHRSIQAAAKVLVDLAPMYCMLTLRKSDSDDDLPSGFAIKRKKGHSQKQRKKANLGPKRSLPAFDKKEWDILEIDPPETVQDVPSTVHEILNEQREILIDFLQHLRNPKVVNLLNVRCVYAVPEYEAPVAPATPPAEPEPEIGDKEAPSAYPMVQPMKSALHFDSPDGFGAWRIIISKNAHDVLRTTHKKDITTFDIIVKKIKRDLSTGHFSDDNQKRLSGAGNDVPIFEAKMTRDLRLIYQVDLIPVEDHREQQAIEYSVKIFGIHTHAQMDHRLWDSISSQLRKRGKVYCERCSARKRSEHADKDIFLPETFPPLPVNIDVSDIEGLPDLLPNDTAQVHSRLVVEKFVTFSQPFLNTILADLDVTLPHLVSAQEKEIIENPTSCYVIGRSGTGKTTTMLFKMLLVERTFHFVGDDIPRPRQVFVTKSRMLARKVQEYFSKVAISLSRASQSLAKLLELSKLDLDSHDEDVGLIDADDVHEWRTDLPKKFSDLEDKHFPLFVTYDGLCDMLEADITGEYLQRKIANGGKSKRTLITFESFLSTYWAHFSETARKGLDPALVYSELIGVIKGSEEALREENRYLSKEAYLKMTDQQQSTLSGRADEVYSLFQSYMSLKKVSGEYDVADRTHNILTFFALYGVPAKGIDHLYIDEVQDNLLIDTLVLRAICSNPNGLFWAGDTAQTISVGSSFRFDSLKAFHHRLELQHRDKQHLHGLHFDEPRMFQLAINYRSHAGIVNCAHSIIDLINFFWDDSIDRLAPEYGIVDGFKPAFFSNEDRDQLEHFIFGGVGSHIEFGAQQCILVRNETAKEKLLTQIGEVGLVLTIYESKGLEFNDVLLYDFFSDSVVDGKTWRVVLNAIEDWSNIGERVPAPAFETIRHATICTELKSLYVAITRARENVWIADGSDSGRSLRAYWTSRNLIHSYAPGNDAPQLATSSTSLEWMAQGRALFELKRYSAARHCYTRAQLPKHAAIANAYHERQKAHSIGNTQKSLTARRNAFRIAGDSFLACAEDEVATTTRQTYFKNSAACLEGANDLFRAAEVHVLANNFDRAGELYRDLKKFDEAIKVVNNAREQMNPEVVNSIIKRARLAYFDAHDIEKGRSLFNSTEDALEYLDERVAAGEIHYTEGLWESAFALFIRNKENTTGLQRALDCILEELWRHCSFGVTSDTVGSNGLVVKLLAMSKELMGTTLNISPVVSRELDMFTAILTASIGELLILGMEFYDTQDFVSALLCLDHVFSHALNIEYSSLAEVSAKLEQFSVYVTLLSLVTYRLDPSKDDTLSRLFGFSRLAENIFRVPPSAWLFGHIARSRRTLHAKEFQVTAQELHSSLQSSLTIRLRQRAEAASAACSSSKAFSPCLSYVVTRACNRTNCPENHIAAETIDKSFYNQRIRAHLQQIIIMQSLRETTDRRIERSGPMYWINKLYNALYPPHHALGTISILDMSKIPEAEKGLNVVRHWIQTLAFNQTFDPSDAFLTDVMRTTSLALAFDRHRADYLRQAPFWSINPKPPHLLEYRNFIVQDLQAAMSGYALGGGALALGHIIRMQVPIDVSVLCNYLDYLCGSFILCTKAKQGDFHDVTIPKSWLLKYISWDAKHFAPTMQPTRYTSLFARPNELTLGVLLDQMYSGAGHLLYGSCQTLDTLSPIVRGIFIARVIRAICLLGYNIPSIALRENIRRVMLYVKKPNRIFPALYREFIDVSARSWDDVARTLRRSFARDPAHEIVHMLRKSEIHRTYRPHIGVQPVVFIASHREVLSQLGSSAPDQRAIVEKEFTVELQVPQVSGAVGTTTIEAPTEHGAKKEGGEDWVEQDVEWDPKPTEQGSDEEQEEEDLTQDNGEREEVPSQEDRPPPSEEEHAAATVLQKAYRRISSHRKGIPKSGIVGTRYQISQTCLQVASSSMERSYRVLFLGPLVHLLVCLDIARVDSMKHKNTTKERLKGCPSEEYDKLDDLLTQTNRANKAIIKLQKELQPKAQLHQKSDKNALIRLVGEANSVLSTLPFTPSSDWSMDLNLCVKGVLTTWAHPHPKPKPQLTIDDGTDDYESFDSI